MTKYNREVIQRDTALAALDEVLIEISLVASNHNELRATAIHDCYTVAKGVVKRARDRINEINDLRPNE